VGIGKKMVLNPEETGKKHRSLISLVKGTARKISQRLGFM
jgi:hypothetical protein